MEFCSDSIRQCEVAIESNFFWSEGNLINIKRFADIVCRWKTNIYTLIYEGQG